MYNATRQKPNILRRYRTFKPTNYDSVIPLEMGRNTEFANAGEWYIAPVQAVRDRSALERSNWDAQRAELKGADPHSMHHEVLSFGHWAVGWFEMVIVRPRSKCWRVANDMAHALADYPILDEQLCSEYEFDECLANFDAGEVARSLQNQYEAQQLRKRTVEWIKEHVTFDMCANAPNLDYEMDDGAFRWRLLTDWRDEARWRADVAELLAYWRAEAHK